MEGRWWHIKQTKTEEAWDWGQAWLHGETLYQEQTNKNYKTPMSKNYNCFLIFPHHNQLHCNILSFFFFFFFGGTKVCKAGTLLFETHLQSILFWLFWKWGTILQCCCQTKIFWISASQRARIADLIQQCLVSAVNFNINFASLI
jgi:hypothetical protein